ncbi:MAG: SAM-dependent methyltransferase [Chloroflexi bacterium]|nr:MAG: SAM-dependent methyltransferase [Chloroflexota bacterium]
MGEQLDYEAVRQYWDRAAGTAAAASYMAHEQGLPQSCVDDRFALEREVVERWFADLDSGAAVLDIGCGSGAWTALFAQRYRRVVGIEQSAKMVAGARERLHGMTNVELIEGDCLDVPIEGHFQGAFFGGLLMYLNHDDAVRLLVRIAELVPNGKIILRESSGRQRVEMKTGDYHVAYRTPDEYAAIAAEAGLSVRAVERNRGYARMEVAVEVVNFARRLPALKRRDPAFAGGPIWRALRLTAPISLELVPRAVQAVGIGWPHLTNNFLLLEHS